MNFKNNNGVTLTILTITIIILLTITSTIVYKSKNKSLIEDYDSLLIDIESLSAKIDEYYVKNGDLPTVCKYLNQENLKSLLQQNAQNKDKSLGYAQIVNPNDAEDEYYVIDLEKLDGLTLNYGYDSDYKTVKSSGSITSLTDINNVEDKMYIINSTTHQIYYPCGVVLDDYMYFSAELGNSVSSEEFNVNNFNKNVISVKLAEGMIPVIYEEDVKKWRKVADGEEWYDYDKKQWANVVLSDATFDDQGYLLEYDENNVAYSYTMLVWIPRYAYRITSKLHYSSSYAGDISIKFINTDNKDEDGIEYSILYPTTTDIGTATGSMDDYVVHPAFEYGTEHLSGFWIGKFECGIAGITGSIGANSQTEYNGTDKQLKIAGGQNSWRKISIDNAMTVCWEVNKDNNVYGLNSDDDIVDPHLIKNTEWGAVAYLSDSIYGIQQGENNRDSYVNTSEYYITGDSSTAVSSGSAELNWKDIDGYKGSTTGTIYGVYDMSGGADEYVAAFLENNTTYSSIADKYKNVYAVSELGNKEIVNYNANSDKFGDAMYEVSYQAKATSTPAWNSDEMRFMYSAYPLLTRGGSYNSGSLAGVFASYYTSPDLLEASIGFRLTIAVLE